MALQELIQITTQNGFLKFDSNRLTTQELPEYFDLSQLATQKFPGF